MPAIASPPASPRLSAPPKETPIFDPASVSVIFVLGGPGAGKGTQCANIVRDYGFKHLSAGDLLRAEQDRPNSEFGSMIKEHIQSGQIVPMEVTVQLLENAMQEHIKENNSQGKFLIDGPSTPPPTKPPPPLTPLPSGFPRKMDQAQKFESAVCPSAFTLFFDCPPSVLETRLLNRGKTSGRADDNADSIRKRFRVFVETSMPVVEYFAKLDKVEKVEAVESPEVVYGLVREKMGERGFEVGG